MRSFIALVALTMLARSAVAAGLGAEDRRYVDGVVLDPKSGAVSLLLVVDRPLEDGLTKATAKSKLLGYVEWVRGPRFARHFPNAHPEAGVTVVIAYLPPKNALGQSVLEQLQGYAKELGVTPKLQQLTYKAVP